MANEYRIHSVSLGVLTSGDADVRVYATSLGVLHSDQHAASGLRVYSASLSVLHSDEHALLGVKIYGISISVLRSVAQGFFPTGFANDDADDIQLPLYEPIFLPAAHNDTDAGDVLPILTFEAPPAVPDLPFDPNPYRPDLPPVDDRELFDYLRHQAETLRQQHNVTQQGDTTFPWELAAQCGSEQQASLGSLTRFFHSEYGVLHARYVKFSDKWTDAPHAVVGHDRIVDDWVVTNVASRTSIHRLAGIAMPYAEQLAGKYGWILVHGRCPFDVVVETDSPAMYELMTGNVAQAAFDDSAGRVLGKLLKTSTLVELLEGGVPFSPKRWRVPAGDFTMDVFGETRTDSYIIGLTADAIAALDARIDALDGGAGPDYAASIAALTTALNTETTQRQIGDNSLDTRLDALESAGFVTGAAFAALSTTVATLSTDYTTFVGATNAHLTTIDSQITSIFAALGVATLTAAQVSVDPATFTILTSINAQLTFKEIDLKLAAIPGLYLDQSLNLSDLASAGTARTNLGLGTMAVVNDAASDGQEYVRKNAAWAVATSGGGGGGTNLIGSISVPALSGFTQLNISGTRFVTEVSGKAISIGDTNTGSTKAVYGIYKTAPTAPYRIAFLMHWGTYSVNYHIPAFGWRQASDGKLVTYYPVATVGNYQRDHWNSATSNASQNTISFAAQNSLALLNQSYYWLGIRDTTTAVCLDISRDGVNWVQVASYTKAASFLTNYDQIFVGLYQDSTSGANVSSVIRGIDESALTRTFT